MTDPDYQQEYYAVRWQRHPIAATSRSEGDLFRLTAADKENETVRRRIRAKKRTAISGWRWR
jgi:hypothetical protein